jgi:hypothetical protein
LLAAASCRRPSAGRPAGRPVRRYGGTAAAWWLLVLVLAWLMAGYELEARLPLIRYDVVPGLVCRFSAEVLLFAFTGRCRLHTFPTVEKHFSVG